MLINYCRNKHRKREMIMAEHINIEDTIPVGPLGLIVHESCKDLGAKIDKKLVAYRKNQNLKHRDTSAFFGYE